MQDKIDALTDIVKAIRNDRQRKYALSIIIDLVNVINRQSDEIKGLHAFKTNNKINEIDCELQKYVHLLILFGYSQKLISSIRPETLLFAAKNRERILSYAPEDIKNIDLQLMCYELENGEKAKNVEQLKQYIDESKG